MSALDQLRDALFRDVRNTRGHAGGPIAGCTESEVSAFEAELAIQLPKTYREFLLAAGKHPPNPLIGTDCHFSVLPCLREWAEELLAECNGAYELPPNMFVFSMHQGYQFCGFMLDEGDDPPVHCYLEGEPEPSAHWPSFTSYLELAVFGRTDILNLIQEPD